MNINPKTTATASVAHELPTRKNAAQAPSKAEDGQRHPDRIGPGRRASNPAVRISLANIR